MKRFFALSVVLALGTLCLVGCGGSTKVSTNPPQSGAVYVTGEDAPLSSVVSLNLTINSISLSGLKSSPVLVSSPITVDFARLVGLRAPLVSARYRLTPTAARLLCWPVRSSRPSPLLHQQL